MQIQVPISQRTLALLQTILWALMAVDLTQLGTMVPPKVCAWIALGIGALKAFLAIYAQHWNIDGTPQETAYTPEKR